MSFVFGFIHVFLSQQINKQKHGRQNPSLIFFTTSSHLELKLSDVFSLLHAHFCLRLPAEALPEDSVWIVLTQTVELDWKGQPAEPTGS